jgi:hypothetical protein
VNQSLLYGIVLLSAVGHASWNALLKRTTDRLVMMVAIRIVGLIYGVILLWIGGAPSIESLKWLIAAAVTMWIYQVLLIQSYRAGDLSFVYPLAPWLGTGFVDRTCLPSDRRVDFAGAIFGSDLHFSRHLLARGFRIRGQFGIDLCHADRCERGSL